MTEKSWAETMYGEALDASPAPVPAAKPAAAPPQASTEGSSWAAVMHKPAAPATEASAWTATMHKVEEPTGEPGPWSGADPEALAADAATVALPEKYEFNLPEGVEIAPEMNSELQSALKEAKLAPEKAQALIDLHVKSLQSQQAAFDRTVESWSDETMQTLGSQAPEVFAHARAGLERFDQQGKIRELLDRSGLGNRIEFVRLFEQIGRDISRRRP